MSPKANEFITSCEEPPSWFLELCNSPVGRSLFLYILRDTNLRDRLYHGDYNGLFDFFLSSLIVNSENLYTDLKGVSLASCTLSTSLLLYERVVKEIMGASSYDECDRLINQFVNQYVFSTAEELCIFFNYITEIENAFTNENIRTVLSTLSERIFRKAGSKNGLTPVSQSYGLFFIIIIMMMIHLFHLLLLL